MSALGIVEAGLGTVNGITSLIGAKQQRKAQAQENRNQLVQMVLASKMQHQQAEIQQRQEQASTNKTTTYLLIGGIGFIIIVLIGFIVWQQQKTG